MAALERAKRGLQENLRLIAPHSPGHVPIQAQTRAIDTELAARAKSPTVNGSTAEM